MNAPFTMADVIVPKSDQWNSDDFIAGPITFTIREVQIRGGQEQPVNILLEGTEKAFRPCKSMSRVLVQVWGPDAKVYVGRSLTLYRDPSVKWGGMEVAVRLTTSQGYTAIPWRGKPAEQCPDGPRYKALGNSMAVPVMRWIGERIAQVETLTQARAA